MRVSYTSLAEIHESSWALGDVMDRLRTRYFVGREAALSSLIDGVLHSEKRVFWVSGPGGIGKSALLERVIAELRAHDRNPVRVDCEQLEHTPEAIQAEALTCSDGGVLLFDNFDQCEPLWVWWKEQLLRQVGQRVAILVGSRLPPPASWWLDPAWAHTAAETKLNPLPARDASDLARALGVPDERVASVVRESAGHPLTLCLLAENVVTSTTGSLLEATLSVLMERCSSDDEADALRVGMLTQWVSETLLADVLHVSRSRARTLCHRLASQPFVSLAKLGLRFHPLVAEASVRREIDTDPDAARTLRWRVQEAIADRLARAPRREAAPLVNALQKLLELEPNAWMSEMPSDWRMYTQKNPTPAELDAALLAIAHYEGASAKEWAKAWCALGVTTVHLARDATQAARGYAIILELDLSQRYLVEDPLVDAWLHHLRARTSAFQQHQVVRIARFIGSYAHYQTPSPELRALFDRYFLELFCVHELAASASVHAGGDAIVNRPDRWLDVQVRLQLGPREFTVVGMDWRVNDRRAALQVLLLKARGQLVPDEPILELGPSLQHEVTRLLKRLHLDVPVSSPLLGLAVVRARTTEGASPPSALSGLLRELCRATEGSAVNAYDAELLSRTFCETQDKRLAIAATFGLSYSTYRRHLSRAVEHLVQELETRERQARARGTVR